MPRIAAVLTSLLAVASCAAPGSAPISPLVGTWSASFASQQFGTFTFTTGREVDVKQPERTAVGWEGSFQIGQSQFGAPEFGDVSATLKTAETSNGYLLDFKVGSGSQGLVEGMPVAFTEGTGFSGTGTIKFYGKPLDAKASIVIDRTKDERVWKVESIDGKLSYTARFSKAAAGK